MCSNRSQQFKQELRVRVPCPLDGAHSVYAFDLEKHVKVCNRIRQAAEMKSLPYYTENINSGSHAVAQAALTEDKAVSEEETVAENEQQPQEQEHSGPTTQQEQSLIDRLVRVAEYLVVIVQLANRGFVCLMN